MKAFKEYPIESIEESFAKQKAADKVLVTFKKASPYSYIESRWSRYRLRAALEAFSFGSWINSSRRSKKDAKVLAHLPRFLLNELQDKHCIGKHFFIGKPGKGTSRWIDPEHQRQLHLPLLHKSMLTLSSGSKNTVAILRVGP